MADAEPDPHEAARAIALRQLGAAPKSRHQLEVKLAERHVDAQVAAAVLDRFEAVRLIDDAEFARMWVDSRARTKGLARSALRRELSAKGITGEIAEEALSQLGDDDERQTAADLVGRKLPHGLDLDDRAVRDRQTRRLVAMLARKGYAPGLALAIVGEAIDEQRQQAD